jgi:glycosyltransferase involved in cell wall biosynthesis
MTHSSRTSALREPQIKVFVLAKNEACNIGKCLESLRELSLPVSLLLDHSSTDDTARIASRYSFVDVVKYDYMGHCVAYNQICTSLSDGAKFSMVLDADMIVTQELFAEIAEFAAQSKADVIKAPVLMYVEGHPFRYGSLYPPKAIVFRAGRECFVPAGHGEALMDDCVIRQTKTKLIHDDRKVYSEYLNSQLRYAQFLIMNAKNNSLTWRDVLRMNTPLMIFITPFFSYFIRLGLLSGKASLVYALDRLIAEAVMFRQSLAEQLEKQDKR